MNTALQIIDDVAELPEMTAAELKAQREYLGLSTAWIAEKLVIGERRIQRMEAGKEKIPHVIVDLIDNAQADAKAIVEKYTAIYRRKVKAVDGASVILPTYRTDRSADEAGQTYPSRWHRHVAARVADSCARAILDYFPESQTDATGDDNCGRDAHG